MNNLKSSRRDFLTVSALTGSALILNACVPAASNTNTQPPKPSDDKKEKEVTAIEDLMREHGILRRALLVFGEAAVMLPGNPPAVWADAVQKAAKLFRAFGEDYHEKKLEEGYIFPLIKQKGMTGPAASYPDILIAQHNRGREITDYILSATASGKMGANASDVANALHGFVRMYENHAAREDTVVFPAWKDLITENEYDELGEKFEDIEHEEFGDDGYEDAVKKISEIESSLGLSDISIFTPAAPAKV
ncbi:MAG TPA: hemerythrin domain-containing protein [Pyrinomonadaceae bacterium]|nr:hemerythrin domain-containing protein [Pyrinomonadaceae bacterium]